MFLLHAFKEIVGAHVPVHLVGFGDEEAGHGFGVVTQLLLEGGVEKGGSYFGRVYHELAGYAACQAVEGTNAADGEVDGLLIAAGEAAVDVVDVVAGANGVSSGVDCFFELPVFGQPAESGEGGGMAVGFHLIIYGVGCVVAVDVYVDGAGRMKLWIQKVIINDSGSCCAGDKEDGQEADEDFFLFLFHREC